MAVCSFSNDEMPKCCTWKIFPLWQNNFQGITAGCKDIYYNNIDCQWIDITDLEVGKYPIHFYLMCTRAKFFAPFSSHTSLQACALLIAKYFAGTYVFKMSINPEYKVAEITFENNAALCTLYYSQMTAVINNCTLTRP